jgi:hypothetical protein
MNAGRRSACSPSTGRRRASNLTSTSRWCLSGVSYATALWQLISFDSVIACPPVIMRVAQPASGTRPRATLNFFGARGGMTKIEVEVGLPSGGGATPAAPDSLAPTAACSTLALTQDQVLRLDLNILPIIVPVRRGVPGLPFAQSSWLKNSPAHAPSPDMRDAAGKIGQRPCLPSFHYTREPCASQNTYPLRSRSPVFVTEGCMAKGN